MVRMLVVESSESEPIGALGEWLRAGGAELEVVLPAMGELPGVDGFAGVVCLGGDMGAYEDAEYPWLAGVRRLLGQAVAGRVPVLAICLGAQLLAAATGGQVRRGPQGPEVGPGLVAKRDAAAGDPLFADLPMTPDVMQWHHDEIAVLPSGAELLAAGVRYQHQAFRVGRCAYGLQFHIETTPDAVLRWVREDPEAAATVPPARFEQGRLDAVHADLAEVWAPLADRFVRLAAGELPMAAARSRTLPLL